MLRPEEIKKLLQCHRLQHKALISYQEHALALYVLEARHTLFHVHRLLQNQNNPSLEKTLENFLKTRWERLRNTDAQYFYDTTNPANQMCVAIAKMLGRFQNKPYLLFLIPTLSTVPAAAYFASSYEDELNFKQLILSDDATRMIHIPEVLEFAEQDGVLKHASHFNGKRGDLSIAEESRLLARHPSVENYYHALRDKLNFQMYGETAGAYLARLISGLREGGALGSGAEFITGAEANVAISDFSVFLESLTKSKKKKLLNAGKTDRWRDGVVKYFSIGQSWTLLENSSKEKEAEDQDEAYCVELIANDLEEILNANPMLYLFMPFQQEGVCTLASFDEAVTQSKQTMLQDLNTSKVHRYYGVVGNDMFALDVLSKIVRDTAFYLKHSDMVYVASTCSKASPELRACCTSILWRERAYIANPNVQKLLKKDLSEQVLRDVNTLILPQLNRYSLYSASELKKQEEEEEVSSEHAKKKTKHVHFDV